MTTALVVGGAVGLGTAQAIDVSAPCPSATPSAAQVVELGQGIVAATTTRLTSGQGFAMLTVEEDQHRSLMVDAAHGIFRRVVLFDEGPKGDHLRTVGRLGERVRYDWLIPYSAVETAAIRRLKLSSWPWVASGTTKPTTLAGLADEVTDQVVPEATYAAEAVLDDGESATFACEVTADGELVLTTSTSDEDGKSVTREAYRLLAGGAVANLWRSWLGDHSGASHESAASISYVSPTLTALPTPRVSSARWQSAVIKVTLPKLRDSARKLALKKFAAKRTLKARVATLRAVTRAQVRDYWYAELSTRNVSKGIKVWVRDPAAKRNLYVTLKVKGKKIKVAGNVP